MRKALRASFLLLLIMLVLGNWREASYGDTAELICASVQNADTKSPSQSEKKGEVSMLKALRPGHPRLIALESDIERVRRLIESNPQAKEIRDKLYESAVQMLEQPPVEHRLIGPRLLHQSKTCLDRVYTLLTVYRLSGERRFAERAIIEMLAAARFPDWNPSHFLDTAEMSHALAIGYDWLYDTLSEEEKNTIREALVEKGLKPAMDFYRRGGWWVKAKHNWNQVCNGGIGIAALAIAEEEPEMAEYILQEALKSIRRPMAEFASDGGPCGPPVRDARMGGWVEGPGYWDYATSYNVYFLAALESALGDDQGLKSSPGFDKTGFFRIYFTGPLGLIFNFADAREDAGGAPQMFWLARTFNQSIFAWHQRQHLSKPHALDLIWFDARGKGPVASNLPLDAFFRGVDVVFFRSAWEDPKAIFIGFKGGDNRANHSHLDLGNFVMDAGGYRWAVDLGPDDYDLAGYFGKERWTYYRLSTPGHNTLTLGGQNQNPEAKAPIIGFGSSPARAWAVTDLSSAYAKQAKSVLRGLTLISRKEVLVQDELVVPEPVDVVWSLHTQAKVELMGNEALLSQGDWRLKARILEPAGAHFEVTKADPPPPQAQQPNVIKLQVRLSRAVGELRLAVLLSPYPVDSAPPVETPEVKPLKTWLEDK